MDAFCSRSTGSCRDLHETDDTQAASRPPSSTIWCRDSSAASSQLARSPPTCSAMAFAADHTVADADDLIHSFRAVFGSGMTRHLTRAFLSWPRGAWPAWFPTPEPGGLVRLEPGQLLGHQEALRLGRPRSNPCASQQPGHPLRSPAGQRRGHHPGYRRRHALSRVLAEGAEPLAQARAKRTPARPSGRPPACPRP